MVAHLGKIERTLCYRPKLFKLNSDSKDVYHMLRAALIGRVHGKEIPIRALAYAAVVLSKLWGLEGLIDVEQSDEPTVLVVLVPSLPIVFLLHSSPTPLT